MWKLIGFKYIDISKLDIKILIDRMQSADNAKIKFKKTLI